ncbi:hypothetical protein RRG08_010615 [Elysia crispata]|uniref:Uncharacterized protein n=1 Tax=Elysia crispata TaxID=231223 RepID=A0AAE1AMT6_9GAST|nr:hypothetical protein RRG08_010615 [Elysia crispata]
MNTSSRSRNFMALVFIGISVLFLTAIVLNTRGATKSGPTLGSVHLPRRSYAHHARQLTSTEIDDVIQGNPSLSDWVRSLVEWCFCKLQHASTNYRRPELARRPAFG